MSRWQNSGTTGLTFPADPETLRTAGPGFLIAAMRAFGALSTDNEVAAVTRFDSFRGGSTGRKAVLDVRYRRPDPALPTALFVKFSRDFDDPRRDRGSSQMELEVAFGCLSAATALPITVHRDPAHRTDLVRGRRDRTALRQMPGLPHARPARALPRAAHGGPRGRLECGLMDWGCVSVMNVAMALWGSLRSAETVLWDHHLDDLLTHFGAEYTAAGGPALHLPTLRDQLLLYAAVLGVTWLLDAPAFLATQDLAGVTDRDDPRIADNEPVRAPLLMLTNFLNLWCTHGFGAALDRLAAAAR